MTSAAPPASPAGALPPGACIAGSYRVEGVLGTGGMGTVYRARHLRSGEAVALKVLHSHLVQNHQVSERFQREASILRRLRGRHLVGLLDFGQDEGGQLYMALELVEGEPLDRLVRERAPLPPGEAAQLVGGICDALASAHAHGVVHRDLTPANVMVERDELGRPHVRVFDFGLAKALHDAGTASVALTQHNMIFGTAEYMSPEQVRGEELDGRADVYAAGAILYELLTGRPPFRGGNDVITMTSHLTEAPEAPSQRLGRPDVISPQLDAVVLRALAKTRDERFASAHALRDAVYLALRPERPSHVAPSPARPAAGPSLPPPASGARPSHPGPPPATGRPSPPGPPPPARPPFPSAPPAARPPLPSAPPDAYGRPSYPGPPPGVGRVSYPGGPPGSSGARPSYPGRPQPPGPGPSVLGSDTMLAAPVVVAAPPSQGAVDPFTTTMTLQAQPPAPPPGPASLSSTSPKAVASPGPIRPDSLAPASGFRPLVWVSVALLAVLLGVALGVGLTLYR